MSNANHKKAFGRLFHHAILYLIKHKTVTQINEIISELTYFNDKVWHHDPVGATLSSSFTLTSSLYFSNKTSPWSNALFASRSYTLPYNFSCGALRTSLVWVGSKRCIWTWWYTYHKTFINKEEQGLAVLRCVGSFIAKGEDISWWKILLNLSWK